MPHEEKPAFLPMTPFDAFNAMVGKLVRVPKKEVDRKEAAYQRKRAKKRGEK